jgi:hypothetical protein
MSHDQVLTSVVALAAAKGSSDQPLRSLGDIAVGVLGTILDIQRSNTPPSTPADAARQRSGVGWPSTGATACGHRRKPKRAGGWPSSPSLPWKDVKRIDALAHEAERCGCRLTHLITVMPDPGDDMGRKRECARIVAHLGQSLKRHGKPHVGVTVYEKSAGADLHAHHLVHIPRGEFALVERLHAPPMVHVRRSAPTDIGYITKERRPLPPEVEAHVKHRRKKGAPIPGKRWTATSAALELITENAPAKQASINTADDTIVRRAVEPVQLTLALPLPPPVHLFELAEKRRAERGLLQTEAARVVGIHQPHWSNAVIRGHDTLSPWALNRIRDFIANKLAA